MWCHQTDEVQINLLGKTKLVVFLGIENNSKGDQDYDDKNNDHYDNDDSCVTPNLF